MQITQLSRTYSRSIEICKPDGLKMWIKHEMTATASTEESDGLKGVGDGLEEICRKEVGASIKAEQKKIAEAFAPKVDEPFPGKTPFMEPRKMPKL